MSKPSATLVVSHFPPDVVGGAEINAALLADFLHDNNWQVTVLTGAANLPRAPYKIICLPALRPRPSLVYEKLWASRAAKKVSSYVTGDIVHAFDVLARSVVAELGLNSSIATIQDVSPVCGSINKLWQDGQICPGCSPLNLTKNCLTTHQYSGLARLGRTIRYQTALPYRQEVLTKFKVLTTVSKFLKNYLNLEQAVFVPDLLVPPNEACPLDRYRSPTIVSIGRLAFDKGTDLILRSLRDLPEFKALLIGSGDISKWQDTADKLGVGSRVEFVGSVSNDEVGKYYHLGDVSVLASRSPEASSRTVLEAMSLGKAVVAPKFAGPAELIVEGSTGRLFERGNPESLAKKIDQAYRERESLGRRAAQATAKFHPEVVGPKYLEIYEDLLELAT